MPTMAVIIAYEEELPKYVNIDFTRYKVSLFIPSPLRCAKCQRYGHKAGQCRSEKPRCPKCAEAHEYGACQAAPEEVKCANCGEKHSSAYKGCTKYRQVSNALKLATTQKMSYRDALQQSKAKSTAQKKGSVDTDTQVKGTPENSLPVLNPAKQQTQPVVARKSVETQTDELPQTVSLAEADEPADLSSSQMATLLKTTAGALLWLIENLQQADGKSDIIDNLNAVISAIGSASERRDLSPSAAAEAQNLVQRSNDDSN